MLSWDIKDNHAIIKIFQKTKTLCFTTFNNLLKERIHITCSSETTFTCKTTRQQNQLYVRHIPNLNQTKPDTLSLQRHYIMVTTMLEKSLVLNGGMVHSGDHSTELQTRVPAQKMGFGIMITFLLHNYFEFCS